MSTAKKCWQLEMGSTNSFVHQAKFLCFAGYLIWRSWKLILGWRLTDICPTILNADEFISSSFDLKFKSPQEQYIN
jgi:hypothetical protein